MRTVDAARSFASDTFFRLPVPLPAANVFYYTASAMDGWPYHDRLAVSKAVVHFAAALLAKEFELYLSPAKHLSQTQSANLHAFSRNFEHFGLFTLRAIDNIIGLHVVCNISFKLISSPNSVVLSSGC